MSLKLEQADKLVEAIYTIFNTFGIYDAKRITASQILNICPGANISLPAETIKQLYNMQSEVLKNRKNLSDFPDCEFVILPKDKDGNTHIVLLNKNKKAKPENGND
jgi:hypothetical protein